MNKASNLVSGRTQGDGMEFEPAPVKETIATTTTSSSATTNTATTIEQPHKIEQGPRRQLPIPGENSIYRPPVDNSNHTPPPTIPKGNIFHLIPKLSASYKANVHTINNREPRFVPFEPYKAAITPLIPSKRVTKSKLNRNNLDLNVLVSQMSVMKANEMKIDNGSECGSEVSQLQRSSQIDDLIKEKEYFQSQLKFQVQVNSELKNLLVAAVGEDLQTRVNVLTEDKLQLARALLDSAHNLSSHTEQIEYLAGQSEVWRSKFLASSLMVEELARWKASLTAKNAALLDSNKQLLEMVGKLREMQIDVLRNMNFLTSSKTLNLQSSNIMDLTAECLNISQQLVLHSGYGMPENLNLDALDSATAQEKRAIQALQNSNQNLIDTDAPLKAIVGHAFPSMHINLNPVAVSALKSETDGQ